jgi:ATP-dependent helicase/nuclease subunit A
VSALSHTIVLASAGTGKTFRLANRYIALLAAGADPASILATTFTRKAAGEIMARILSRLAAAASDPAALADLRRHIGSDLSQARCIDLASQLARGLHRVKILTIDAFLSRLVSTFGPELGIDPASQILDEDEDRQLRSGAAEDALGDGDEDELLGWFTGLAGGAAREVHGRVLREVAQAYQVYLDAGADAWSFFGPRHEALTADAIGAALGALPRLAVPTTAAGGANKVWEQAIAQSRDAAGSGDWAGFLAKGLPAKILAGEPAFGNQPIDDDIRAAFAPLIQHAANAALAALRHRNTACASILSRFDAAYTRLKRAAGRYTFDDVPRRLLAAGVEGRLDEVYYRLDAVIRHLLLDEFQDTSLVQFRLLEPIIDELVSRDDSSVFCVGDPKQSLYTWRGAEPELLASLATRWPQLRSEELAENFRSSPVVLDAVNRVFGSLATNTATAREPAATAWSRAFARHAAHHMSSPGQVRLVTCSDPASEAGEPATRDERTRALVRAAALRVAEILAVWPSARIGVLLRRNKPVAQTIHALTRLGIDAAGEGGNPLADAPPVAAAASLLHLADHPGDTAALFHIATSPLGPAVGLIDPLDIAGARRIASGLRDRIARQGAAAVLTTLMRGLADSMDQRGLDRFRQLIDLAHGFDQTSGSPADLARLIWSRPVEEPGRRHVSVLTVHRAKGLEFDVVVLPDLDGPWRVDARSILAGRPGNCPDPFAPINAATFCPNQRVRALHPGLAELYARAHDRVVGEELCTLYVAMTRAIHILEMIVPPGDDSRLCAASVLCNALAPGAARDSDSILFSTADLDVSDWAALQPARAGAPNGLADPIHITLASVRRAGAQPAPNEREDVGALWRAIASPQATP